MLPHELKKAITEHSDLSEDAFEYWCGLNPSTTNEYVVIADREGVYEAVRALNVYAAELNGTLVATWNESHDAYHVQSLGITSLDGEEWLDEDGNPPDSEEFQESSILFDGGPLNGEIFG